MTPERTKLLNELGFVWNSGRKRRRQSANFTSLPTKSITPADYVDMHWRRCSITPADYADMPDEDIVSCWHDVTPSDDDFAQTFENLCQGIKLAYPESQD